MAYPRDVVVLSDEQFNKIVELLTPGYELAKAYMASMRPDGIDQAQELDPDGNPATGGAPGQEERTTSADDESQKGGG